MEEKLYRVKVSFSCLVKADDEADAAQNIAAAIKPRHLLYIEEDSVRNVTIQTNGQYHKQPPIPAATLEAENEAAQVPAPGLRAADNEPF